MAWTKTNFYLTLVFLAIITFVSLAILGDSILDSSRISVDERSIDYIGELKGISTDSGFEDIGNSSAGDTADNDILDSEDNFSVSKSGDFLSTLFVKKERANQPTNYIKLVYNIPSTILKGVGLPINDFKHIINIIVYTLFLSIIILVWRDYIRT